MMYLTSLTLGLMAVTAATAGDTHPLSAYPRSNALAANLAWHKAIGENEIRMSWFLHGDPGIAMVCTADLSSYKVTTSREVYDHASQSTKTRELSHAQVETLRKLARGLPASAKAPKLKNLVLVSVSEKGKVKTYLYDRFARPRDIIRLYDLTGASAGRTQKPAAAPKPKDLDDFRWLLNRAKDRNGLDRSYKAMLEKLEKSKVPTAKKAKGVALHYKLNSGGIDAREGAKIVGLLRIGITVPEFAASGDLIWVVRFSMMGPGVTQEMWISSTTGAIRTMLPVQKQPN